MSSVIWHNSRIIWNSYEFHRFETIWKLFKLIPWKRWMVTVCLGPKLACPNRKQGIGEVWRSMAVVWPIPAFTGGEAGLWGYLERHNDVGTQYEAWRRGLLIKNGFFMVAVFDCWGTVVTAGVQWLLVRLVGSWSSVGRRRSSVRCH
jgi:hypothetical protein